MKRILCFAALALTLVLCSPSAVACSFGMYTYNDAWLDGDGNLVSENYTSGDTCSGAGYVAYADATVTLPSSNSYSASASGGSFAEAVTQAATANEQAGDGSVYTSNEVDYSCGDSLYASGILGFHFGYDFQWFYLNYINSEGRHYQALSCPDPDYQYAAPFSGNLGCKFTTLVRSSGSEYLWMGRVWASFLVRQLTFCSNAVVVNQSATPPAHPYCYEIEWTQ